MSTSNKATLLVLCGLVVASGYYYVSNENAKSKQIELAREGRKIRLDRLLDETAQAAAADQYWEKELLKPDAGAFALVPTYKIQESWRGKKIVFLAKVEDIVKSGDGTYAVLFRDVWNTLSRKGLSRMPSLAWQLTVPKSFVDSYETRNSGG